jgi:hypothetical protein
MMESTAPCWGLDWKAVVAVAVCINTVALYVFVAVVNAMHTPTPMDTPRYKFWFKVLHALSGQLTRRGLVKHMERVSTGTIVESKSPFHKEK